MANTLKIKRHETYGLHTLSDIIACMAANLEDAYRTAGVTDYTAKGCVDIVAREVIRAWVSDSTRIKEASIDIDTITNEQRMSGA
jgi:hypothetical protein